MDCRTASTLIHDLLDDDLSPELKVELHKHMEQCPACKEKHAQFHKTLACLTYCPEVAEPEDFCQRIMRSLPKVRLLKRLFTLLKLYPGRSLASFCGMLFLSSWIISWDVEEKLVVKIPDQDSVLISGDHVIVPYGTIIHGNMFAQNAVIDVAGEIEGDLIVMNGMYRVAPTAVIHGEVHEIDHAYQRWMLQMDSWISSR
jgi:anti-sigma factor RsiW